MKPKTRPPPLETALLDGVGLFCRGSVLKMYMPCGKPGCRCQATPPRLHGPYYRWTRKVRGKTVTRHVHPRQAKLLRQWIANGRRLDTILRSLESVSATAIERALSDAGPDHPQKGET